MKIKIVVHSNSKRPRIAKDSNNITHVYVGEPALEGKANRSLVKAIAKQYKTSKSCVKLISGNKSKYKTLEIN